MNIENKLNDYVNTFPELKKYKVNWAFKKNETFWDHNKILTSFNFNNKSLLDTFRGGREDLI